MGNLKSSVCRNGFKEVWLLEKLIGQTLFGVMAFEGFAYFDVQTVRVLFSLSSRAGQPVTHQQRPEQEHDDVPGALHRSNQGHKTPTEPPLFPRAAG